MRRRSLFAGLMLLTAAAEPEPFVTIRRLYASLPRPTPPALLSRRLRALMRADESSGRRKIDFEWRSGGETRPEITEVRLRLARLKGRSAVVEASFFNRGERRFRRFFLVVEDRRWVVDDALLVPENVTLQELLRSGASQAR